MKQSEKTILLTILEEIRDLKSLIPSEFSLAEISNLTGKSPNTLRKHIISRYEPEVDYKQKGNRIYVKQDVALRIRRNYAK